MAMKFVCVPLICVCLISCGTKKEECPPIACTLEFRSIGIRFKAATGEPIIIKDFQAVIRRTGESIQADSIDTGTYVVVTDNDTRKLSTTGDTIDVSAVNPETNQKKMVALVVSGGKCACHIEKISGIDEAVFD